MEALMVVIPKPQKPDYSLHKAYHPNSLLECCGKLLEKVVARRILSDAHSFDILSYLPTSLGLAITIAQSTRPCLTHQAQAAVRSGAGDMLPSVFPACSTFLSGVL